VGAAGLTTLAVLSWTRPSGGAATTTAARLAIRPGSVSFEGSF
jgi:hypothetical protein